MTTMAERIAEGLARPEAQLAMFSATLNKIDEIINGTSKSGGLKERIAIAEEEIKKNITELRTEMLIEVGKISKAVSDSKPKGINWNAVMQAVVTAIAVGVTGIAFWQIVIWLAAHSPVEQKNGIIVGIAWRERLTVLVQEVTTVRDFPGSGNHRLLSGSTSP
jgi:hypothetical protein